MPCVIAHGLQQPVLVIAAQQNNSGWRFLTKAQNPIDALTGIRSPIDVVAEKNHGVLCAYRRLYLVQQIIQRAEVAVNVAYRDRRHSEGLRSVGCVTEAA